MFRFDWWRDENNRDAAKTIVDVLKVVVPAGAVIVAGIAAYLGFTKPQSDMQAQDENVPTISVAGDGNTIQTGDGNISQGDNSTLIIGFSEEMFREMLAARESQIRTELEADHAEKREVLLAELAEIERQKQDIEAAYAENVEELRLLRLKLRDFEADIPREKLEAAQQALYQGDRSLADQLLAEIEDNAQDEVFVAAEAAFTRGKIAEQEIRWHEAAAHYARAARLNPTFETLDKARRLAGFSGDFAKALRYGQDLLDVARAEGDDAKLSTALNNHAIGLDRLGRYAEAEEFYIESLELKKKTLGEQHPDYATSLQNLAGVVEAQGRYAEAEALYRKSLEIDEMTIGTGHPSYATSLNNLGLVVEAQGRYPEAEGLYRQAMEIDKATIGDRHPNYATSLNNLAGVIKLQRRYAEAEELFRQALEIGKATLGEKHPSNATRLNNLAIVVDAQGRYVEAEGLYRAALDIGKETIGEAHPNYAIRLNNLAGVVHRQGRDEEAEKLYRKAMAVTKASVGSRHPSYGIRLLNLGVLLIGSGKTQEGGQMLEEAMDIFRATLPADHPHIAVTQSHLDGLNKTGE